LKQKTKSFIIDVHTSRTDHNTDWPRDLQTFTAQTMTHYCIANITYKGKRTNVTTLHEQSFELTNSTCSIY